jgi:hypothetical protein
MGTWGTGLYSDDLASDLRGDLRGLLGEGLPANVAVDRLISDYAGSLADVDEAPVFWLALADASWKLGRLDERVRDEALRVIDEGRDLARWESPRDRKKREAVLAKLRAQLLSPQPAAKRLARVIKSANEWAVGEVIALQLLSRQWVPMRVIGHHTDKGGRFAVCELLDWIGQTLPSAADIASLQIRREKSPRAISQFLFQEPRTAKEQERVVRLGLVSTPLQRPGGYAALIWPYIDRQIREIFDLE